MALVDSTSTPAAPGPKTGPADIQTDWSNANDEGVSPKSAPPSPLRSCTSVSSAGSRKSQAQVQFEFTNASGKQDSFTLCEHWCDLLNQALENSKKGEEYSWLQDFGPLHYAAQKNNHKMCQFLLESPECKDFAGDVHALDSFYKKPVDHLKNAKGKVPVQKQPLADYIQYFMDQQTPDEEKERLYQDVLKHGPPEYRKKKEKIFNPEDLVDAKTGKSIVYIGETGPDMNQMMTAYEVESALPQEMRKNFRIVAKGGFGNFNGNWGPKGESPLHWAASRGRTDICRFLCIVCGADVEELKDQKGRTAIQIAKTKKHRQLAKELHTKEFSYDTPSDKERKDAADKARKDRSSRGSKKSEAEGA